MPRKTEHIKFSVMSEMSIVYGIVSLLLHCLVLSAPVFAGTETGEFCPTCPDWNDMDGWLAKKAAYEQEPQQKIQLENQTQETLLGDAGISSNEFPVIANECPLCNGGPSPAIFAYWLHKSLGHDRVQVLDGSVDDLVAARLNTSKKPATRPKTNYTHQLKPELLATYDFVVNGGTQIVDARPARDLGMGSIPGDVNTSYENVIETESRLSLAATSSPSRTLGFCERKESIHITEEVNRNVEGKLKGRGEIE